MIFSSSMEKRNGTVIPEYCKHFRCFCFFLLVFPPHPRKEITAQAHRKRCIAATPTVIMTARIAIAPMIPHCSTRDCPPSRFVPAITITCDGSKSGPFKDKNKQTQSCPSSHPLPYLTLPYLTLPYPTLSYPTLPYLTLPYLTLPYPTLPYPTLPYLTLPYLTLTYPTYIYCTCADSSVLYTAYLKLFGNLEIVEQHYEDEEIVDGERLLHDVPREKLERCLLPLDRHRTQPKRARCSVL